MIRTQTLVLPLQVARGALSQVVGFVVDLTPRLSTHYIIDYVRDTRIAWLDIGYGIPGAHAIDNAQASVAAVREGRAARD